MVEPWAVAKSWRSGRESGELSKSGLEVVEGENDGRKREEGGGEAG